MSFGTSSNDDLESNLAKDPSALSIGENDADPSRNTQGPHIGNMFPGARNFKMEGSQRFINFNFECGRVGVFLIAVVIVGFVAACYFPVYNNPATKRIQEEIIMPGLGRLEPFVSHEAINGSSKQHPERQVHPGTRERVLSQIKVWIDNPSTTERILWLHGPAGVGKSTIAQTIAHSYTTEKIPANFFFFHSDSSRNNGNRLFTTLAWKFASSIPDIQRHIVGSLNKDPDLGTKGVETQFQELIVRPFEALPQLSDMVVVIDGIDEASYNGRLDTDLQERVLKVIGNAATNTRVPLRFLIFGRPETHIQDTINHFRHHTLSIDLAKYADADRDIETYLKAKLDDIAKGRNIDPAKWPGQEIIQKLVFKASGQFMYASTVVKFVGDKDNSAKTQLDIVLGLKLRKTTQPFAELDRFYTEILERQSDQKFLKTFLASLVAHHSISGHRPLTHRVMGGPITLLPSSCSYPHLRRGYGILMDVPEEELRLKLRNMASLLDFTPRDIGLHQRSFLEFLQDPSRSGQYNISTKSAARQYLLLVIDSLVRSSSLVNEQHDDHPPIPEIVKMFGNYPSYFDTVLFREDWRGVVRPLLELQDRLLKLPNFTIPRNECTIFHIVHRLLLHYSYRQLFLDTSEGYYGSWLLTYFRDQTGIFGLMNNLRHSNPEEIAMKVHSWSEAQQLMDRIDHIVNGKYLLTSLFTADATRKATKLALEIHTRVPVLPKSFGSITNADPSHHIPVLCWPCDLEALCRLWLISNFLDHRHIFPAFGSNSATRVRGVSDNNWDPIHSWRQSTDPSSNVIIFVMLNLARAIQYLHSMEILLSDSIRLDDIHVDSGFRVRISSMELVWSIDGHSLQEVGQRYETDIYMFGYFFCMMYFDAELACTTSNRTSLSTDSSVRCSVWRLIQRCFSAEGKPTINEVVQEMESWKVGL